MSDNKTTVSLGDFAALLVREVTQALVLAQNYADYLEVRSVRVCLGQIPDGDGNEQAPADDTAGNDAGGFVLTERYPFFEKGWELAIELDTHVRAKKGGDPLPVEAAGRVLLDVFGDLPVAAIKGVSKEWEERLRQSGILTVRSLAKMTDKELAGVMQSCGSRYPRELRGKARLLENALPALPVTSVGMVSLYDLIFMQDAQVGQLIGSEKISTTEVAVLAAIIDILAVSLDVTLLRRYTLGALLFADTK